MAAVFLVRRRGWARWAGVLATGGVTVASLLLLVLSIAGLTSLLAGTTRDWLPGAERPA